MKQQTYFLTDGQELKQSGCDHKIPVRYENPGNSTPLPAPYKIHFVLDCEAILVENQHWYTKEKGQKFVDVYLDNVYLLGIAVLV